MSIHQLPHFWTFIDLLLIFSWCWFEIVFQNIWYRRACKMDLKIVHGKPKGHAIWVHKQVSAEGKIIIEFEWTKLSLIHIKGFWEGKIYCTFDMRMLGENTQVVAQMDFQLGPKPFKLYCCWIAVRCCHANLFERDIQRSVHHRESVARCPQQFALKRFQSAMLISR